MKELLPPEAFFYCNQLWEKYGFTLKLVHDRKTKFGYYKWTGSQHIISVNANVSPQMFLTTYIHEVAHLLVKIRYKTRRQPHGIEWKKCFQELMQPLLSENIWGEMLLLIKKYMENPTATFTAAHKELYRAIYPTKEAISLKEGHVYINQLLDKQYFEYNGRFFMKIALRRTRILCEEIHTKKKYLFSSEAMVKLKQISF